MMRRLFYREAELPRGPITPDELAKLDYDGSSLNSDRRLKLYEKYAVNKMDIHETIGNRLKESLAGDETIVSVGCGSGRFELGLYDRRHKGEIIGVNNTYTFYPAEQRVKDEGIRNVKYYCEDATDLSMKDNSADIALALFMFYHVTEPQKVLSELRRVLKPDGQLIVATRGVENLRGLWGLGGVVAQYLGVPEPQTVYAHFSAEDAKDKLSHTFTVNDKIIEHRSPLRVTEDGWDDYEQLLLSMRYLLRRDRRDPVLTTHELKGVIERSAKPVFDKAIADQGYFEDYVHQAVFECTNGHKTRLPRWLAKTILT